MKKHRLGKDFSLIYRYSQIYFDTRLKKFNLGSGQYIFLMNLLLNNGINQEQLADLVKINKATTARAVANLEKAGYVTRKSSKKDKRSNELYTSKKAESIKDTLLEIMDGWNDIMLEGLSSDERLALAKLIEKVGSNIRRYSDQINDVRKAGKE